MILYIKQKKMLKKVSQFPTYGSQPYSDKGFEGGKEFHDW